MKSAGLKLHQHRPGNLGTCVVGVNAVASAANGDVVVIGPSREEAAPSPGSPKSM